jgi:SAM-dependent methyltransferase
VSHYGFISLPNPQIKPSSLQVKRATKHQAHIPIHTIDFMMASITTSNDPTFRSYTCSQAKIYATHRLSYPAALYDSVLKYHSETGGHFGLLLDVGCGPGNATRDVALSFEKAIGVDPGASMIEAARELDGKTKAGEGIRYEVCPAEEISKMEGLEEESVDLLISAMAVSD